LLGLLLGFLGPGCATIAVTLLVPLHRDALDATIYSPRPGVEIEIRRRAGHDGAVCRVNDRDSEAVLLSSYRPEGAPVSETASIEESYVVLAGDRDDDPLNAPALAPVRPRRLVVLRERSGGRAVLAEEGSTWVLHPAEVEGQRVRPEAIVAWAILFPLTVPFDLATLPLQLPVIVCPELLFDLLFLITGRVG